MTDRFDLRHGDSRDELKLLGSAQVDALVTDPPAGIGFMGKEWDTYGRSNPRAQDARADAYDHVGKGASPYGYSSTSRVAGERGRFIAALRPIFEECLRVLKPGAHGLVWALPRTSHWTATALEEAGFEIRDRVSHFFGTGFPKSLDVSKAIDNAAGAEREVIGQRPWTNATMKAGRGVSGLMQAGGSAGDYEGERIAVPYTAPATDLAREWEGWGTALKPACEDWWLVRKPLDGTVAANVAKHGTGALNIDGCRIGTESTRDTANRKPSQNWAGGVMRNDAGMGSESGRWPANVTLDEEAAALLDEQSGELTVCGGPKRTTHDEGMFGIGQPGVIYPDTGGASRFFYVAKPDRAERDIGCEDLPAASGGAATDRKDGSAGLDNPRAGAGRSGGARNIHPTVKSIDLMRWLCRLITPRGGLVLDPFMGSGSTGVACSREGFRFIGIERERQYFEIAKRRLVGDAPLFNRSQVQAG